MTKRAVMIDIESTGVDIESDSILSIAMVKLEFAYGEWLPRAHFETLLHYPGHPVTEFAKEHMAGLYQACNLVAPRPVADVRKQIEYFLADFGNDAPTPMGWNATTFDLPFCYRAGFLKSSDFHYRSYEMSGVLKFVEDATTLTREQIMAGAKRLGTQYVDRVGVRKRHDALFDCYHQTDILNGLIKLVNE